MLSNGYTLRCRERGNGNKKVQKESGVIDREIKRNRDVEEQCNKKEIERERREKGGRSFFTTPVLPPSPPPHTHTHLSVCPSVCLSLFLSVCLSLSLSLSLSLYLYLYLSLSLSLFLSQSIGFFSFSLLYL